MREQMMREMKAQEELLQRCLEEVGRLPEGAVFMRPGKKSDYYYQSIIKDGKRGTRYLSAKRAEDREIIRGLLRKQFLAGHARILSENVKALSRCVANYRDIEPKEFKGRGPLPLAPTEGLPWKDQPYERASMYPEKLKVKSINGLFVRSKSESMIALSLDLAGVPFHYEEVLRKGEVALVPDFTLLHKASGEKILWEHFGMMEDEDYAEEAIRKLKKYVSLGIFPGSQLILTMETEAMPLGIEDIRWVIRRYFGD